MTQRWRDCIVAASGPSLTPELAEQCHGRHVIAVNDAWKLLPWADILYSCDQKWWDHPEKAPQFRRFSGEKWIPSGAENEVENRICAQQYGLNVINAKTADDEGFCFKPGWIHFGSNSGYQAVNLALNLGAKHVTMIGFDMQKVKGKTHFFGDHPAPLVSPDELFFALSIAAFNRSAESLPSDIRIVNATPGSALKCFPVMSLDEANNDRVLWHWSQYNTAAG